MCSGGSRPGVTASWTVEPCWLTRVSLLRSAGLDIDAARQMYSLSLIEKQLVEILKAIDRDARVIVMDEPTSSLTDSEVKLLFRLIQQLCTRGAAVIYISHHLEEVFSIADRVTVLRDGWRISTRPLGEVTHDSLVREMVGGLVEVRTRGTPGGKSAGLQGDLIEGPHGRERGEL